MKRYLHLLLAVALALGVVGMTGIAKTSAQEGPTGTWLGTWPYRLPPEHTLNAFAAGGLIDNLGNVYQSFVELPHAYYLWASGEYVPLLGDSWGFADDGSYYWTQLNPDATWSDGSPVTADDVLATYAIGRILQWPDFNFIADVTKVDDQTVHYAFVSEPSLIAERYILKNYIRDAATYGELAARATEVYESGAAPADEVWTTLADEIRAFRPETLLASGPYVYSLDDVGDAYMTLHWQPNSIFSDSVRFGELRLWAGETEATTPLVLSGELAHSTNVYPPSTQEAFENAGIRLITLPRGYGPSILFNHDLHPWNVPEVRQAIAMVVERSENAFLTNGLGATATVYMAGLADDMVELWMTPEAIEQLDHYDFDPDRAAALLESIGYSRNAEGIWTDTEGNTLSGEFKFPAEFDDFSGMALNATEQMNEFGFDITARAVPWQQAAEDIRNSNFEISVWSWSQVSPFPGLQFYGPVQRFNYVGLPEGQRGMNFPMEFEWNGESVNLHEMINAVSTGLDVERQRELASEVALIINELLPYIPLNMLVSVEPFNETLVSGGPPDDDPLLQNPSGTDHPIIWGILTGMLGPA